MTGLLGMEGGAQPGGPGGDADEGIVHGASLAFWHSPDDQPRWARPALLAVAAAAGLAYGWAMTGDLLEPFYAAAARSMGASVGNFVFGSFDPWGTITVDKLPGGLWPDALSVRLFGFHIWAVMLPHVVEGVLTVLVLYRAVRRVAGPVAGLAAAAALAASPVTVLLDRGNIPDTLMTLLLVLAADATIRALTGGGRRALLGAGAWVGLAFLVKMTEAWLVLPALLVAYLVAAPVPLRSRLGHVLAAGAVTLGISVGWLVAVSLVPAADHPYFDGSTDNSVFVQTFAYNGVGRLPVLHGLDGDLPHPQPFLRTLTVTNPVTVANVSRSPGPLRVLAGRFADDDGWLLPAAVLSAAGIVWVRRRRPRTDLWRATALLWTIWLVVDVVFLSSAAYLNSYYLAIVAPPTAALCGTGLAMALRSAGDRRPGGARLALAGAVAATAAYALYLVPGRAGIAWWLRPATVVAAVVAATAVLFVRRMAVGAAASCAAALFVPVTACALVVLAGLGPFDAPFEPTKVSAASGHYRADQGRYGQAVSTYRWSSPTQAFGVDSSGMAAEEAMFSGHEIYPIGGFSGGVPEPTLPELRHLIAVGRVNYFDLPEQPVPTDPRVRWIEDHCHFLYHEGVAPVVFGDYYCPPSSTSAGDLP